MSTDAVLYGVYVFLLYGLYFSVGCLFIYLSKPYQDWARRREDEEIRRRGLKLIIAESEEIKRKFWEGK